MMSGMRRKVMAAKRREMVNHPDHYRPANAKYEAIDVI